MSATARHARRRRLSAGAAALLAASFLSGLAVTGVTLPDPAQAVEAVGASTSARTVAWAPRHPDDRADAANPAAYKALKDLRVRVSQTEDLLNQTVEVSFAGLGETNAQSFLQLMQCWSDGPAVPPTREQCAYGGTDIEGAEGSAFLRTRQLGIDPRERTYRNDGGLSVVAVDGTVPTPTWTAQSELVLGTNQQRCPAGTVGFSATLVPPRDAVAAGLADVPIRIELIGRPEPEPEQSTQPVRAGFIGWIAERRILVARRIRFEIVRRVWPSQLIDFGVCGCRDAGECEGKNRCGEQGFEWRHVCILRVVIDSDQIREPLLSFR